MKIKVSTITVVQIRHESYDRGKVVGFNKKFQQPKAAAEHWSFYKAHAWELKKFDVANQGAAYHRMTPADYDLRFKRQEKLYRRSLPIFGRLLA